MLNTNTTLKDCCSEKKKKRKRSKSKNALES